MIVLEMGESLMTSRDSCTLNPNHKAAIRFKEQPDTGKCYKHSLKSSVFDGHISYNLAK